MLAIRAATGTIFVPSERTCVAPVIRFLRGVKGSRWSESEEDTGTHTHDEHWVETLLACSSPRLLLPRAIGTVQALRRRRTSTHPQVPLRRGPGCSRILHQSRLPAAKSPRLASQHIGYHHQWRGCAIARRQEAGLIVGLTAGRAACICHCVRCTPLAHRTARGKVKRGDRD